MGPENSFLVYYGHNPELLPKLKECELLIFESRGWTESQLSDLRSGGGKLIAYISPFAWPDWMGPVKWWWGKKERDPEWNAWWLSPAHMGWKYQLKNMWRSLRPKADGLFFDNLDRLEQDPKGLKPLQKFLQEIREEWPDAVLLGNRGFTHWSSLNKYLDGVLFENLTDQAFGSKDRAWVVDKLESLRTTQVYALDYETRRVDTEALKLREQFPKIKYYCAPDESLQTIS